MKELLVLVKRKRNYRKYWKWVEKKWRVFCDAFVILQGGRSAPTPTFDEDYELRMAIQASLDDFK